MTRFFAFQPDAQGNEPLGTSGKTMFQLKTNRGGIRRAIRALGHRCRVYTYTNFYDERTFTQIYPKVKA